MKEHSYGEGVVFHVHDRSCACVNCEVMVVSYGHVFLCVFMWSCVCGV